MKVAVVKHGHHSKWTSLIAAAVVLAGLALMPSAATASSSFTMAPTSGPANRSTRVALTPPDPGGMAFKSISAGTWTTLAIGTDGNSYGWGNNKWGQLGDGTVVNHPKPTALTPPYGVKFKQLSNQDDGSIGLSTTGDVYTWGGNYYGSIGDGTFNERHAPGRVTMPTASRFVSVSGGRWFVTAVAEDGTAYAWGINDNGELGDGSTLTSLRPRQVLAPGVRFKAVSSGVDHTLALTQDGEIYAWGWNAYGQIGNNSTIEIHQPQKVSPAGVRFVSVNAGGNYSSALASDGSLYMWGLNANGVYGNGSSANSLVPTKVFPSGPTFASISAGYMHMMGLTSDGRLFTWGDNTHGQIGDGSISNRTSPYQVSLPGVKFTSISGGHDHSMAIGDNGNSYGWGFNDFGRVGDGSVAETHTPVVVMKPKVNVTAVSFGGYAGTDLRFDDASGTWKVNAPPHAAGTVPVYVDWTLDGAPQTRQQLSFTYIAPWKVTFDPAGGSPTPPVQQVADGERAPWPSTDPTKTNSLFTGWYSGSTPYDFSQPVTSDLTLTAHWASLIFTMDPKAGPISGGTHVSIHPPQPTDMRYLQVSTGFYHSLAIGTDGRVWSWGHNDAGQLGINSTADQPKPVQVQLPAGLKFNRVVAGPNDSFAFASDGSLYAWGADGKGQLGDGRSVDQLMPVRVSLPAGVTQFQQIFPSNRFTFGIGSDGLAYAWGANSNGQLGDGTYLDRPAAVKVQLPLGVHTFTQLSGGASHSLAIGDDGKAYAWGWNGYGQLGSASVSVGLGFESAAPVPIDLPAGVTSFKQVSANIDWSLGIGSNGRIYTWGYNGDYELGDGSTTDKPTPTLIATPSGVSFTQVSTDGDGAMALGSNQAIYAWGNNTHGQLGSRNQSALTQPTLISPPNGVSWTKVMSGWQHSLAIDSGGAIWAVGDNQFGQLGNAVGGRAGDLSLTPVTISNARIIVTSVKFGSTPSPSTPTYNGTDWHVDSPSHSDGPVPVGIEWTLDGAAQPTYTINSFLYYTFYALPTAGALPFSLTTGSGLMTLSALAALAWAVYAVIHRLAPARSARKPK
ncbi:hypothetical protein KIM372_14280 [Bombiscardovia nodaiensis]|uniref:RCC1-like domain-containing protein n=1 Tax=Bombiscardovia nodaiensis TaxID=2932181 RepID=A0ABN6SED6_9BIFI|nr:hypothetical protein KIM372_14280 [Bombiscardovia nodaiensis]